MKHILATVGLLAAFIDPVAAQWQVQEHAVPVGRAPGVTGFQFAAPATAGYPFVSKGASSNPSFGTNNLVVTDGATGSVTASGGSGAGQGGVLQIVGQGVTSLIGNYAKVFGASNAPDLTLFAGGTSPMLLYTNGLERFRIDGTTGFIGINKPATAPTAQLDLNGTFAVSGVSNFNNLLQITPAAGLTPSMNVTSVGSGTLGTLGTLPFGYAYNYFGITDAIAGPTNASYTTMGLGVRMATGGATVEGTRAAVYAENVLTAATKSTNANRFWSGGGFVARAQANDGGGAGTERGALFGGFSAAIIDASVNAHLANVTSWEFNMSATPGSTIAYKSMLQLASLPADQVHGTTEGMIAFSGNASSAGWNNGMLFTDANGIQPITTTGCILCTAFSGTPTIAKGIDISAYRQTGNAFASNLFSVNGNGSVTTGGYLNISGNPGLGVSAITNPYFGTASVTSQQILAVAQNPTLPEVGSTTLINSSTGGTPSPSSGFKIAGFFGATGSAGTGSIYALNGVAHLNAGVAANVDALAIEGDVNVNNAHYSDTAGPPTSPVAGPMYAAVGGAFRATALYMGQVTAPVNRGMVFWSGNATPIRLNTIEDYLNAQASYVAGGTYSDTLINLQSATGAYTAAIKMPNAKTLTWRNAANSADIVGISINGSNQLELGTSSILTKVMGDLFYTGSAWTPYTPTASCLGGSATWGTLTNAGKYKVEGKSVRVILAIPQLSLGSCATAASITLPFTPTGVASLNGRETNINGKTINGYATGSNVMTVLNYDNTVPGGTGALLTLSGTYEIP